MPVMDGFSTLEAIREKNSNLKIVMCSADDSNEAKSMTGLFIGGY